MGWAAPASDKTKASGSGEEEGEEEACLKGYALDGMTQ